MTSKRRLSVTVDADLVAAAEQAVERREAANVSAWITEAMRLRLERDKKLRGLTAYLTAYEAEFGAVTDAASGAALREAKRRAKPVGLKEAGG